MIQSTEIEWNNFKISEEAISIKIQLEEESNEIASFWRWWDETFFLRWNFADISLGGRGEKFLRRELDKFVRARQSFVANSSPHITLVLAIKMRLRCGLKNWISVPKYLVNCSRRNSMLYLFCRTAKSKSSGFWVAKKNKIAHLTLIIAITTCDTNHIQHNKVLSHQLSAIKHILAPGTWHHTRNSSGRTVW